MKKILSIIFILSTVTTFAQGKYPLKQSLGSDSTLVQPNGALRGRIIVYPYTDTASANKEEIRYYPGALISVGDVIYSRSQDTTKWLLLGSNSSALNNGLISIGGITLVDSTVTLKHNIVWSINGFTFTRSTDTSFTIPHADSGYYRRDLIYANSIGEIHLIRGTEDTVRGILPVLPTNAIVITTVDIYGLNVYQPYSNVIGAVPTWQQTLLKNDTTTEAPVIMNNTGEAATQILGNANHSYYMLIRNLSNGGWANAGVLFKNDFLPTDTYNEHSGHFLQMYMGSTNSAFSPDGGLIRSNGLGGIRVALDSGTFKLGTGSPSTGNYLVRFEMGKDGNLNFYNYKNNASKDSVLSTDSTGKVGLQLLQDKNSFHTAAALSNTTLALTTPKGDSTIVQFDLNSVGNTPSSTPATYAVRFLQNDSTVVPTIQDNIINTTGMTVTWSHPYDGVYVGTFSGTLSPSKTIMHVTGIGWSNKAIIYSAEFAGADQIQISVQNTNGTAVNDFMNGVSVDVEIYP